MTAVTLTAFTDEGSVTWNRTVDVATLDPQKFKTSPNGIPGSVLTQNAANSAFITFEDEVTAETGITYFGNATNFLTPQNLHI